KSTQSRDTPDRLGPPELPSDHNMEGKPAAEVSAAVPSEWPEDCEALSLDRVLQRFAQQETALRRVAKDLAVETQRHEKLMAKLEAMVWDRFAGEDSFPKSPASPSESVMLERPREPTLERPQGGSRLWGSQVEQMASAKSKAPHIHDLYTANDLLPQITRAQRDSALVGGHDWIMHIRNYLSSYTSDMMLGIAIFHTPKVDVPDWGPRSPGLEKNPFWRQACRIPARMWG
ncbi:unnamed protein product, partial [Effrenium voratum]